MKVEIRTIPMVIVVTLLLACSASIGLAFGLSPIDQTICGQTRYFYSDASHTTKIGEITRTTEECGCEIVHQEGSISQFYSWDPYEFCF